METTKNFLKSFQRETLIGIGSIATLVLGKHIYDVNYSILL